MRGGVEDVDEEVAAAAVFEEVLDSRGAIAYFRGWSGDRGGHGGWLVGWPQCSCCQ